MAKDSTTLLSAVSLLRPEHWIKNLLVGLPLLFSGNLLDPAFAIPAFLGFMAFNFASSAIYVFNDINDVDSDRKHPEKRHRPLASGAISITAARALGIACLVLALAFDAVAGLPPSLHFALLCSYLALNVLYTLWLKHLPIYDVSALSLGFLLRVLYGGAICDIPISSWLFLTVLSLAFFFSLGKRRNEIRTAGTKTRRALGKDGYTDSFLDRCMYVFLACGLVFYALWATTVRPGEHADSLQSVLLLSSVFIAMFTCMLYTFDIEKSGANGDPVSTVTHDKALLAAIALWCVVIAFAIYL